MSPSYRIEPFDRTRAPNARVLGDLHQSLLAESPVPLLGRAFMEQFYYSTLPREGAISGAVAYVDDAPAGFIVVSHQGPGFMRSALMRHLPKIGWLVGWSVLRSPRRIVYVWEAIQLMRAAASPQRNDDEAVGQVLSFGVLPPYRRLKFVRESGLRIGHDLLAVGLRQLRDHGIRKVTAAVHRDNLEAQLFYRGQGWLLTGRGLPGWRVPAVELTWQADGS